MQHRTAPLRLRGMTWNHSRGYTPLAAIAQRFSEISPGVEVIWEKRSLQEFADQRIDQLAERYDLLVIDHPWAGLAAASGLLLPLDEHLPAPFLEDQASNSVGLSHQSYFYQGHQWALAIDAATPVATWRPDLLAAGDLPQTWDDLMRVARAGMVLMPGIPVDALMNFYMVCSTLGEDICQSEDCVVSSQVGEQALGMLRELTLALDPIIWDLNPVGVYETMTLTDRYAYCPFAYGYNNYSRLGYAHRQLEYGDMVEINGQRCRTTLGGAGLAISSRCADIKAALEYAVFVAGPVCQRTLYFDTGGQPGHRSAWTDERINLACRNFFLNTLPALERAFLRPRYPGYISFQDRAGVTIRHYLRDGGDPRAILAGLNSIHKESTKEVPCGRSRA
ncbi:MAG: extracellular solute-binding protein [Acidobacteriia bacterium]|nr:extracellular solute-binding protein [Terriglobia bacterium]